MQQSSRQETTRRQQQETTRRTQRARSLRHEDAFTPQMALQALLAGGSPEKLPAAAVLALAQQMGNSAMLDLLSRPAPGPQLTRRGIPQAEAVPPLACSPAPPALVGGPDFGGMTFPAGGALEL
ncbi:MAG TPA: hypothetical protein H9771_08570 [Candidatus Faecalibacterium faecipullorum]|uniref:Uncharacterized protein n=1 Tax=Candidatus Faecalibacterium faecipullorum TaxID=2838578 RepID=A0A9D2S8B7_9FIRM|nr:hypothetical protein [Candidatus Faecalibacterium faecipullorum]